MSKHDVEGCMSKAAGMPKQADGITVYLLEELGDARLRQAQLKKYVKEALDLIEKSEQRDVFFEHGAHLIHGIPDTLFKMEKALNAAAMAAARIDFEEIKQTLKPEKADEMEDVLQDVRYRYLQRRSQETPMTTPKQAAEQLIAIADQIDASGGVVPVAEVIGLLSQVEPVPQTVQASESPAEAFRAIAATMQKNPNRAFLARFLRQVIAANLQPTMAQVAAGIYQTASSREEVMKGFGKANPHMSQDALEKAADMWEKHKDVVKGKSAASEVLECAGAKACKEPCTYLDNKGWTYCTKHGESLKSAGRPCRKMTKAEVKKLEAGGTTKYADDTSEDATVAKKQDVNDNTVGGAPVAKFETGKPADPTKDMTPEAKAEWEKNKDKYGDKFKAASGSASPQAFQMYVAKFTDAAHTLMEHWNDDIGSEGYPSYLPSFDEFCSDLSDWKHASADAVHTHLRQANEQAVATDDKESKFEKGKPADPTKGMSSADAAEWKKQTEANKDKFKAASVWKK